MKMYAERKKWDLQEAYVHLRHGKVHAKDCESCAEGGTGKIDCYERMVELHGNLDVGQRKRLLDIADRCPVHRTLHETVEVVTWLKKEGYIPRRDLCTMKPLNTPDWNALRSDYPGLEGGTYMDTSSCGLIARSTADAARVEQEELMLKGSAAFIPWMGQRRAGVVDAVAGHIGGDSAGTALLQNFTGGMSRLAPMLKHRRKVLLVEGDYPTLHAPFKWNGFDVVLVKPAADGTIPIDLLAATMEGERPQLVAISHVQWTTGHMIDMHGLSELCRTHGAWSILDITQSWCSVPIDLRQAPIDILGSSGYKWPLAGFGNGFFHLAEAVRTELTERNGLNPVAAIFEGHLDPVALVRLNDALKRSAAIGTEAVQARVRQLTDLAVEQLHKAGVRILSGMDPAARAGILVVDGDGDRLAKMREAGVQAQLRGAGIRIGIHFYNNGEDIEDLVKALA